MANRLLNVEIRSLNAEIRSQNTEIRPLELKFAQ